MPTKLPIKARAQERESSEAKNWLGLWAVSLGFCAIISPAPRALRPATMSELRLFFLEPPPSSD
jgi:hypothetical protein